MKEHWFVRVAAGLVLIGMALFTSSCTSRVDTEGFSEVTHDEFKTLIVGNTIVHQLAGVDRREYFDPEGTIDGYESAMNYEGWWKLGDGNCVVIAVEYAPTRCWTFLHDTQDDIYYIGFRKNDTYSPLERLEILSGYALNP